MKYLTIILLVLIAVPVWGDFDLTDFTESDGGSHLTVFADSIIISTLDNNDNAYVVRDYGAGYFDGDFVHEVACEQFSAGAQASGRVTIIGLSNSVDEEFDIDVANGDEIHVFMFNNAGTPYIYLRENDGGTVYSDASVALSFDTRYYLEFERDEDVGTYGTIYCRIYSDAGRTTGIDTLSVALHTSKKDFRYFYATQSYGSSSSGRDINGWVGDFYGADLIYFGALDPATAVFAKPPTRWGTGSVDMVVGTVTGGDGTYVYEIDETTGNGTDRAFAAGSTYTDTGESPNDSLCYSCRVTDQVSDTTAWSDTICVYTLSAIPGIPAVSNREATTVDIAIDATTQNSNTARTEYAIFDTTRKQWMDTSGTGVSGTLFVHDILYMPVVTKDGDNPILSKGAAGSWEGFGIRDPSIVVDSLGYAYTINDTMFMMYNGRDTSEVYTKIGLAWSLDNGDTWTKYGSNPILSDVSATCAVGSCIRRANDYIMYFHYAIVGGSIAINYATSTSLRSGWTINSASPSPPVVDTSFFFYHDAEVIYTALPNVTCIDDTFRMVMESRVGDAVEFHIYSAWSTDWMNWSAANAGSTIYDPPDEEPDYYAQANPSLYEIDDGKYVIFYNGNGTSGFQIYCLYSTSLISGWTKWSDAPICTLGAGGSWDDTRIEGFRITKDEIGQDTWQAWYFGLPTTDSMLDGAIGRATVTDNIRKWYTSDVWSTTTVTGLTQGVDNCFEVIARNGDDIGTFFGDVSCGGTGINIIHRKAIGRGIGRGIKW